MEREPIPEQEEDLISNEIPSPHLTQEEAHERFDLPQTETPQESTEPGIVDTAIHQVESRVEEKASEITGNIGTITNPEATTQAKVDASIEVATGTPGISSVLQEKVPIIGALDTLNDLQKDIRNPKKTLGDTIKHLGVNVIDKATFGIGGTLLEKIVGKKGDQAPDAHQEASPATP